VNKAAGYALPLVRLTLDKLDPMNKRHSLLICSLLCLFFVLFSCGKSENASVPESFRVTIRVQDEPLSLIPMMSSTIVGSQIIRHIYWPAAEYDPFDLTYQALLLTDLPESVTEAEGPWKGSQRFDLRLREEASWSDGEPITAADYAFSVKAAFLPACAVSGFASFFSNLQDIRINPADPKQITVWVSPGYMLAKELVSNFNLIPRHNYDPEDVLAKYSLAQLKDPQSTGVDLGQDTAYQALDQYFQLMDMTPDNIVGSGPYTLGDWQSKQYLALKRVDDWWGDQLKIRKPLFEAYPEEIVYQIISDEQVALTALKDGSVDVAMIARPDNYIATQQEPGATDKFTFGHASNSIYMYIGMNNQHPILRDAEVRTALAYSMDVDRVISTLMNGLAQRTVGPFMPGSPNYNNDLKPIPLNIEEALKHLNAAGWTDSNRDGTVDKMIDGRRIECVLPVMVSANSSLGQNVALILQENAAKIGIRIELDPIADNATLRQRLGTGDFVMATMSNSPSVGIYDPYQSWHSQSFKDNTGNVIGFVDPESDAIIDSLRHEEDPQQLIDEYRQFQAELYKEQPVIFLVIPEVLFIHRKDYEVRPSVVKPGIWEPAIIPQQQ